MSLTTGLGSTKTSYTVRAVESVTKAITHDATSTGSYKWNSVVGPVVHIAIDVPLACDAIYDYSEIEGTSDWLYSGLVPLLSNADIAGLGVKYLCYQ